MVAVAGYPNGNIMSRYPPNVGNRPPSPTEDSGVIPMRPVYPRTQYQMQYAAQGPPRVNAGDISNTCELSTFKILSLVCRYCVYVFYSACIQTVFFETTLLTRNPSACLVSFLS